MSEGSRRRGVEITPYSLDLIFLEEALTHLVSLRRKKGECHAATDHQSVGGPDQVGDHSELVGDLGAAQHHDVRACW
jgi:hypothetical protein